MIAGIIPARYASTRFPGKPLAAIAGKTMVQRVYEQVSQCKLVDDVVVATDDKRIVDHVVSFGGKAVMTSADHPSGTDRCREAIQLLKLKPQYIINIQGDEPYIDPLQIDELAATLADGTAEIATQVSVIDNAAILFDKNVVKVVLNKNNEALYFSRMAIPCIRGKEENDWFSQHSYYRHIGMYAYRSDILEKITQLQVSSLEKAESLEQLRWLENGYKIKCVLTKYESHCVDVPGDIEKILRLKRLK